MGDFPESKCKLYIGKEQTKQIGNYEPVKVIRGITITFDAIPSGAELSNMERRLSTEVDIMVRQALNEATNEANGTPPPATPKAISNKIPVAPIADPLKPIKSSTPRVCIDCGKAIPRAEPLYVTRCKGCFKAYKDAERGR